MPDEQFSRLLDFMRRLDAAKIAHQLLSFRDDSICVEVSVPGQRWEVEFMQGGGIEVERFVSVADIEDERVLEVLFRDFSD